VAPCPKNGVAGPRHFWPRGGWPLHTGCMGVAEATPRPLGVVRPPRKAKKKKKRSSNGFRILGVAGPPPRAWGWLRPAPIGYRGWLKPRPGPKGGPATPKGQTHSSFFWWPFRVVGPPLRAWGWLRPWGGRSHPLAKNAVVRPPHFLGKGWFQPPRFPFCVFFVFLFFFFFFNFFLFFKNKNKT
jgi:hypothetical protein